MAKRGSMAKARQRQRNLCFSCSSSVSIKRCRVCRRAFCPKHKHASKRTTCAECV